MSDSRHSNNNAKQQQGASHFMGGNGNHILRCYNMVPTVFSSIDDMTDYLDHLQSLGYNTVWINPIQEAGDDGGSRTDKLTYQQYDFSHSLYAMKYHDSFDPVISVVKRNKNGAFMFTHEQKSALKKMTTDELKEKLNIHSHDELEALMDSSSKMSLGDIEKIKQEYEKCESESNSLRKKIAEWQKLHDRFYQEFDKLKKEAAHFTSHAGKSSNKNKSKSAPSSAASMSDAVNSSYLSDEYKAGLTRLKAFSLYTSSVSYLLNEEFKKIKNEMAMLGAKCKAIEETLADLKNQLNNRTYSRDKNIRKINQKRLAIASYFDVIAIKAFTEKARELGITPIFDLVLNHVATSSPLVADYPEWFVLADDQSFSDVRAFRYVGKEKKPCLLAKNKNVTVIDDTFTRLWAPFINKYIIEYGFDGIRVDCVRKLPFELRKKIYDYVVDTLNKAGREQVYAPVILEELLFSDSKPLSQVIKNDVRDAGGTHITGSVFYKHREWHGGLPEDILEELGLKSGIVSCGAINFTGNHDHTPAANEVLIEMAMIRFLNARYGENPLTDKFKQAIDNFKNKKNKLHEKWNNPKMLRTEEKKLDTKINFYMQMACYLFIKAIKSELLRGDKQTTNEFLIRLRDRFVLNMFSGSAGYYMLAGDEAANTLPTEIYQRSHGGEVYPQRMHKMLQEPTPMVYDALVEMVLSSGKMSMNLISWYHEIDDVNLKKQLIMPYIDFLIYTINSGDSRAQKMFADLMAKCAQPVSVKFDDDAFVRLPRTHQNNWKLSNEKRFYAELKDFIREHNAILDKLPRPTKNTWSHSFKLPYTRHDQVFDHVVCTVRVNGEGFASPAQIIISNLDPARPIEFDVKSLKEIAVYFQQRCFSPDKAKGVDYFTFFNQNPGFHQAWKLIMGDGKHDYLPLLYCNTGVNVAEDVLKLVQAGSIPMRSSEQPGPLSLPATEYMLSVDELDQMEKKIGVSNMLSKNR